MPSIFTLPCSSSVLNNNYYQNEIEVVKLVFDPPEDLHNFSKLQMNPEPTVQAQLFNLLFGVRWVSVGIKAGIFLCFLTAVFFAVDVFLLLF